MKSFFDAETRAELLARLEALAPGAQGRWGTMDPARMLAHCTQGLRMATGELRVRRGFPALIGWLFKPLAYDDRRWKHGAPTAQEMKITDPRAFLDEKSHFLKVFHQLGAGPGALGHQPHPFFGTLTQAQWGKLCYKHLDHHFRQFGV